MEGETLAYVISISGSLIIGWCSENTLGSVLGVFLLLTGARMLGAA